MPILLFVGGTVAIAVLLANNANLDNTASLLFPNAQKSSVSPNPSPILQHYQQQQPPLANQQYQITYTSSRLPCLLKASRF
ncbi:MAG: hypothetical protein WAZ77_00175 [Candidatus Nitrosopolaris sp.]